MSFLTTTWEQIGTPEFAKKSLDIFTVLLFIGGGGDLAMFHEDFFLNKWPVFPPDFDRLQVNLTRGRAMRVIKRDEAPKNWWNNQWQLGWSTWRRVMIALVF